MLFDGRLGEVQAEFLHIEGGLDLLHETMHARGLDLLLMGGYSVPLLEGVLTGSAVNVMLREQHWPIFICR